MRHGLRVVVAPDKFKGTLTATDAAAAIASGWRAARSGDVVTRCPMADGGDGTMLVLASATPNARWIPVEAVDAVGLPRSCRYLSIGDAAVVELAEICGLATLTTPDPMVSTTVGLGVVIAAALRGGCRRVLVALGGSASTDGGAGALSVLPALRDFPGAVVEALVDVSAPLLGPSGAAAVYGPQKGATREQVRELEVRLVAWAAERGGDPDAPGAGAAGGTAYGLATWGATLRPGAAAVAELIGLRALVADADVVITGEGRFDDTSQTGKTCGYIRELVGAERTFVIAGSVAPEFTNANVLSLARLAGSEDYARDDPALWLTIAARRLAHRVTVGPPGQ